jgi:hypothetical protein
MAGWEFGSGSIWDQGRLVSLLTLLRLMPYRSASLRCVVPIPLSRTSSRTTCSPSRSTSRHRLPACRGDDVLPWSTETWEMSVVTCATTSLMSGFDNRPLRSTKAFIFEPWTLRNEARVRL